MESRDQQLSKGGKSTAVQEYVASIEPIQRWGFFSGSCVHNNLKSPYHGPAYKGILRHKLRCIWKVLGIFVQILRL